jgi:hypothetical protein
MEPIFYDGPQMFHLYLCTDIDGDVPYMSSIVTRGFDKLYYHRLGWLTHEEMLERLECNRNTRELIKNISFIASIPRKTINTSSHGI